VAAASIPMGIAQASSTMTDTVVAFWVMCAAAEALPLLAGGSAAQAVPFASLAAGLALLTKPTSAAFVLPVGIFIAVILIRRTSLLQLVKWGLAAVLLAGAVNAGHWARNYDLYGNPISGAGRITEHANGLMTPGGVISNLLRNAALHTSVPWAKADRGVYEAVIQIHKWIQVDPNDPRTTSVGPYKTILPSTSEQRAGNPIHVLLIGIAFCLVLLGRTRFGRKRLSQNLRSAPMLAYVLTAASTFLVFSLLYQWQIFGSRYHMPFFILFAPVTGLMLAELLPANLSRLAGIFLIVTAAPYLFSIDSRPLIAVPGRSLVGSVLKESPRRLLFANGLYLIKPYEDLTNRIKDVKCDQIGLMIRGEGAEYPLWTLLGLPGKPRQIEWITTGPSTQFAKHDFQPCAIICEDCEQDTLKGLSLDYQFDTYRLYLNAP
jgi:4-amino-4-deoxy-L-arabinose transferase-like glycosyltransferase